MRRAMKNINGEQYEGLSDEEEDLGLSDVDLEDLGAINDTDSEGELFDLNKNIEGKRFHSDDNRKVKLEKNGLFVDVYEFRAALKDYIIQECFDIGYIKNEKTRVTTICEAEGCPWRIHASTTPDGATFMIKSVNNVHTCVRNSMKNYATSTWIASKLYSSLRADPYMSYNLMKNELKEKYGIEPHPMQLYRARRKVMEEVEGTHESSYKKLPKYGELLLDINPGSIVKLMYHDRNGNLNDKPKFKRMFICLEAFKAAVFAPSEKQFKEAMEKMSKVDNNAAKYLMETPVDACIESRACIVYGAGRDQYEVNDGKNRHVVDLLGKTCGCTQWQISGLPCIHTTTTIRYKRARIEDYVDVYYSPFALFRSYDTIIHHLPSVEDLLESDILAPPLRRLPGRPKKNMKRAKDEPAPSTIRKRLATMRCKNCQELGHNSRGCQRAPIKAKRTPTTRAQGSIATSSQRMSQTNMSGQQKLKLKMMEKKNKV
ncbi:Zinc finger, PMZ-type, partial [Sesbania bispinosa]